MRQMILIAAFALAACGPMPWASHASTTATATTTAVTGKVGEASSADSAKPGDGAQTVDASSAKPDDNYSLIGRWGDNGDCKQDVTFREDGSFHSYTGGDGHWTLNGDQLVMTGQGGSFTLGVRWIDNEHVDLVNPNGAVGHSQRCADAE